MNNSNSIINDMNSAIRRGENNIIANIVITVTGVLFILFKKKLITLWNNIFNQEQQQNSNNNQINLNNQPRTIITINNRGLDNVDGQSDRVLCLRGESITLEISDHSSESDNNPST